MNGSISSLVKVLRSLPRWVQVTVSVLLAAIIALALIFLPSSCSTIRIVGNDGKVSTSVNQSALDSTRITITYEPRR